MLANEPMTKLIMQQQQWGILPAWTETCFIEGAGSALQMRQTVQTQKGKWACAWGRSVGFWAVQHLASFYVNFQFPTLLKHRWPLPLTASCGRAAAENERALGPHL